MFRLIPQNGRFFEMFSEMASNLSDGARVLSEMLQGESSGFSAGIRRIKEIESRGDEMTHKLIRTLNQSFITPFDREDIHRLASSLDDVLDFVNAASKRLELYKIQNPGAAAGELAKIIVGQTEELAKAIPRLEHGEGVLQHCVEINRLENKADLVCRTAIGDLFEHEKDPITLIKLKEFYEVLEAATDKAEDAANVLEAVVLKSA